jgi:hypothetical protein
MDVSIKEKSFSFGVGYEIQTPTTALSATRKIFSLLPHITLQTNSDQILATIVGESLFRTKFSIQVSGHAYEYHCEKLWKGVDICEGPSGPFHLYQHKKRRYSIFQGETQVAAFSRDLVVIGNGKEYDLRLNPDVDLNLILSMVLCLNTENDDDKEDSTMTFDFGHVGPEDRQFDESWRPKDELNS